MTHERKMNGRQWTRRAAPAALLLGLLFAAVPAHANTYLFSVTGSDILNALTESRGASEVMESAYFGIYLQPSLVQIPTYTYVGATTPNPNDANVWRAQTITDPADLGSGTWVQFSKTSAQTSVTILSMADLPDYNIFQGQSFSDNVRTPVGWGQTVAAITTIMDPGDKFNFVINTSQTLSGYYTVRGKASALVSDSPGSFSNVKEQDGLDFTLSVYVPEPATWGYLLAGLAVFGFRARKRGLPCQPASRN